MQTSSQIGGIRKITIWSELQSLIRPWQKMIAGIAACLLLTETFAVIPPFLLKYIVDDHLIPGIREGILLLALLYLLAVVAAEGMGFVVTYLTAYVAQGALLNLRVRLFAHLQHLPLSYYDRTPLGDVISRCTADVETVNTLFITGVSRLLTRLVQLFTAATAMVILSPRLSVLTMLLIPPLVLATRFFQVHIRDAEREGRLAVGLLNTHLQETLGGVEVVRAFGLENTFVARFRVALCKTLRATGRALTYNVFYTPLLMVMVSGSVALLLWMGTGGPDWNWGLSMGTLTAFILLFQRFFEPIRDLGEDWQTVQSALSGIERIMQVLRIPTEKTQELSVPVKPSHSNNISIELHEVVFGYHTDHPVLHNITMKVRSGEHVAIVGRTGAGKSSLLALLGGLYAPWSGWVRVANFDPRTLTDNERRGIIGVVPQTVQLFSGTIMENLTLGDSSIPRKRVEWAAEIAAIAHFILSLPQGYNTLLSGSGRGEGMQLSEGQQQLLSLARALVWDPKVLILDEATAMVDNASEAKFRAALRASMVNDTGRQRAVVTVAHRLSTARETDRIIVLEGGRIVEEGSFEELIQRGGNFAALVELETAGWDWQRDM